MTDGTITPPSRRAAIQLLESLHAAGVTHLPRAAASATSTPTDPNPRVTANSEDSNQTMTNTPADREAQLKIIADEVVGCTRCPELVANRTQTVFGVGTPHPRLCFLGEAPGADEDRQGEPFVGAAGKLLTKIIENGLGMNRRDVYILNVLKCRPPGNRNPTPVEAANCSGFLDRQLGILEPEYLCCLGSIAAQSLLDTTESIGRLRGRFHDYHGIRVLCTYHPAYLLRNPAAKRQVWDDMKMLLADMGLPVRHEGVTR